MTIDVSWTNQSVRALLEQADADDPVSVIIDKVRERAMDAIDQGWAGPPFDPVRFARLQGLAVIPNESVIDARTVPAADGSLRIEFNPNRAPARVRFSIAHEVAHALFPDCKDQVRHRHSRDDIRGDDWQLEMLCNIGAAEIVMPAGSIPKEGRKRPTIELVTELRKKLMTSPEALVLRLVQLTDFPCLAFSCSPIEDDGGMDRYRVDYALPSRSWSRARLQVGQVIRAEGLAISECMALGYTAKGTNRMIPNEPELSVECIGVPAYQPGKLGRSVGFIFDENAVEAMLQTLVGDATEPRGSGPRIIAHIVNDRARSWGGRGIASAIRKKWPQAHDEFVESVAAHGLKLGRAIPHKIGDELWVVDMVAQAGYRQPKLKYGALQLCLDQLRDFAKEVPASVHMPRIGTGAAGGNWSVIAEQIETTLCDAGIRVTVYDLPTTSGQQSPSQTSLFRD